MKKSTSSSSIGASSMSSSKSNAKKSGSRSRSSSKKRSSFQSGGKKTKNVLALVPKRNEESKEKRNENYDKKEEDVVVPQASIALVYDETRAKDRRNSSTNDVKTIVTAPTIKVQESTPSRKKAKSDGEEADKNDADNEVKVNVDQNETNDKRTSIKKEEEKKSLAVPTATLVESKVKSSKATANNPKKGVRRGSLQAQKSLDKSAAKSKWTQAVSKTTEPNRGSNQVWLPPDWEQRLKELKAEGLDNASIDSDLKSIAQVEKTRPKTTGKYLMPEDLIWCRGHTHFAEKEVLKWFRTFRACVDKKNENSCVHSDTFSKILGEALPNANKDVLAELVFLIFQREVQETIDFKEFLWVVDVLSCKDLPQKLRWAFSLVDRQKRGSLDHQQIIVMLRLLDQVENIVSCEDNLDDSRRRSELLPLEERAAAIMRVGDADGDGSISILELAHLKEKLIYAREQF